MLVITQLLCVVAVAAEITVHLHENSEQYESAIVSQFKAAAVSALSNSIVYGITLLFMGLGSSIEAVFLCESRTGLKNLDDLYASNDLRSMLEELFTKLLTPDDPQVRVHIKNLVWELSDYCRCSSYFNPLKQRELIFFGSSFA